MTTHRTRAGRRSPSGSVDIVTTLALRPGPRLTPAQIHAELERMRGGDAGMSLRTVQRMVEELGTDDSGDWSFATATPDEAELVTPVLADVVEASLGETRRLTRRMAEAVVRVRRAAPELADLRLVYTLARMSLGGRARDVEQYIAFAPWADGGQRYLEAYRMGWIDHHWNFEYERIDRIVLEAERARWAEEES